ncbi:hypothetical protein D3C80_1103270 [compost metagenome]
MLPLGDRHLEERLLERQQQGFTGHRTLVDLPSADALLGNTGQRPDRLVFEQVFRGETNPLLARAADDLDGDDRVAAEFEEVVVGTDALDV